MPFQELNIFFQLPFLVFYLFIFSVKDEKGYCLLFTADSESANMACHPFPGGGVRVGGWVGVRVDSDYWVNPGTCCIHNAYGRKIIKYNFYS